ncbi:hypothetical protein AMATHDRAFT_65190 [Amanita thiersii Skay4041]|uniref:NADP-dependent oxidoreductase domain-containing protein n=1 Tax=Amanita thiersii Skay4041 TaxID=703135 RepID=A0A2A9NBX8_9AGAR|nr:hypothetical protein AMATHDRAFT_65190 [Amanita thiersii Skay4041]
MIFRNIGNSTLPAIGFGTGGLGVAGYGSLQPFDERVKIFDTLYERGCTHWDTADVYGESESLIREWLRRTGKRNEIFIATKFGFTPQGIRGDPEYVREAVERSLRNLGVRHIDLLYLHRVDAKTPIEITIRAMADLVKEGKVKYLGLSDPSPDTLRRAHAIYPISAIQVEFSPFVLDACKPPHRLIQTARLLGIAVVVYAPLARGIVTGISKSPDEFEEGDYRRGIPKFSKDNFPKLLKTVSKIESISKIYNATPAQITLAWTLAQGPNFFVIPGTKKIKYVHENLDAANIRLTKAEVEELWSIAREADRTVAGDRDNAFGMAVAYLDTPPLKK